MSAPPPAVSARRVGIERRTDLGRRRQERRQEPAQRSRVELAEVRVVGDSGPARLVDELLPLTENGAVWADRQRRSLPVRASRWADETWLAGLRQFIKAVAVLSHRADVQVTLFISGDVAELETPATHPLRSDERRGLRNEDE